MQVVLITSTILVELGGFGESLSESQVNSEGKNPCCKAEKRCGPWGGMGVKEEMSLRQENREYE